MSSPESGGQREKLSPEEMVDRLQHWLNDYSDEIPKEPVIGQRTHKVNAAWFQGAFSNMRYALRVLLNNQDLQQEVTDLETKIIARRQSGIDAMRRGEQPDGYIPTTREEIDKTNALLRKVVENLQHDT